jgi:hypothetical protein
MSAVRPAVSVIVDSVDSVLKVLNGSGAEVLEVPNGTRIVARHPDGSVFEYLQPRT